MENRTGLIVSAVATRASGYAERPQPITLGGDKGFDTRDFVAELREINVTPHVVQNTSGRRSAINGRTTRHPGYAVSLRICKRIEEAFGWAKKVAGLHKARHRRLAVCYCLGGAARSASRMAAITGSSAPSLGLSAGRVRTYPGGAEYRHLGYRVPAQLKPGMPPVGYAPRGARNAGPPRRSPPRTSPGAPP